MVDYEFMSG